MVFFLLGFTACENDSDDSSKASISGYWKSTYGDGFEIDTSVYPYEFYSYSDSSKTMLFWGYIVSQTDFTASDFYLTILIKGNDGVAAGSPSWGNDDMVVDSFTVARIKNFTGKTCSEASSPYKSGEARIKNTQSLAESTFTDANGYFDYPADYTKQ
jgi:hypothetical protein